MSDFTLSPGHYVLDENGEPRPEADVVAWGRAMGDAEARTVARSLLGDGVTVSTVFLGLDHRFRTDGPGAPLLFETMIFGGFFDQYQLRYETWDQALAGHEAVVIMALTALARGLTERDEDPTANLADTTPPDLTET